MTIEEKVCAVLGAAATVTALCPAARIKVPGTLQNLTRPYIIHFPVSVEPIQTHSGLCTLRIWPFYQVSVFADSYSSGNALAVVVREALDGKHLVGNPATDGVDIRWRPGVWYGGMDEATKVHHFIVEFRVAEALT